RPAAEHTLVERWAGDERVYTVVVAEHVGVVRHHDPPQCRRVVRLRELERAVDDTVVGGQVEDGRRRTGGADGARGAAVEKKEGRPRRLTHGPGPARRRRILGREAPQVREERRCLAEAVLGDDG